MIDIRYKPSWLPQINAPFNYIIDMLKKDGIGYKFVSANADELTPSQGLVFMDKYGDINKDNIKPIWISSDNHVIDGHHRYASASSHNVPIKAFQIDLPQRDCARALNKYQDIYEFHNQEDVMEVVSQDVINDRQEDIKQNFLEMIGQDLKDGQEILHDSSKGKKKKFVGFRKNEISENSECGNFFSFKPVDDYKKYDMEFDNILDTNDLNITYNKGINPVELLAKTWFPHLNFEKISEKYNSKPYYIVNRIVAEKAKEMGYDGIKYGDIMIQGL